MIESVEFKSETIARKRIAEDLAGARFARLWDRTPTLSTVAERKAYQHKPEGRLETVVAAFPKALQARGAPQWMRLPRRNRPYQGEWARDYAGADAAGAEGGGWGG